jgi:hypothetical protein
MATEEYKFRNGKTITIKSVPPLLIDKILDTRFPKPRPPLQLLDGETEPRKNWAHPDYEREIEDWRQQRFELRVTSILKLGVEIDFDPKELDDLKAHLDAAGLPEVNFEGEPPDYTYLAYVLADSNAELQKIFSAIERLSQPTEEAVQALAEGF